MIGQGDIPCSRLRHKLPLRSQGGNRGRSLADSSQHYTAEGIGLVAGTPENGAVEIEQNRLAGEGPLGSLRQRALRCLAEQAEEFGPRGFLFDPAEDFAGQRRAADFVQEHWW
jgi:hypothetical protein